MHQTYCYTFCSAGNLWSAAEPPRLPLRRELARPKDTKARLRERYREPTVCTVVQTSTNEKQSFAFTVGYIYCFRIYSVYLSLRLPAQILYAGIHLPPQREARALPRHAQNLQKCKPRLSPPPAGCPHPSRCGAAPHRATFPKGKAQAVEKVLRRRSFSPSVFCPHGAKKAAPSGEGAKECA